MRFYGVDTAARLTLDQIQKIKNNGYSFVGRYLVPSYLWKALQKEEIENLQNAGLSILLCWEMGENDISYPIKAESQALTAKNLAESYGVPYGTAIYFACDFNAQQEDFINVDAYLRKAQEIFGDTYKVGLYGHNRIIDYIAQKGIIQHFWQCVAWSNGIVSKFEDVFQYQWQGGPLAKEAGEKIGVAVDLNSCEDMAQAGMWLPPEPKVWYTDAMDWMKSNGIMNDGRPNDSVTRAELAVILKRFYDRFP